MEKGEMEVEERGRTEGRAREGAVLENGLKEGTRVESTDLIK